MVEALWFCLVKPSRFFADAIYDIYQYFDLDGFVFLVEFLLLLWMRYGVVWLVSGFVTAWYCTYNINTENGMRILGRICKEIFIN